MRGLPLLAALALAGCLPEPPDLSVLEPRQSTPVPVIRQVQPSVFDPLTLRFNEPVEYDVPFMAQDCEGSVSNCEDVLAAFFLDFDGKTGEKVGEAVLEGQFTDAVRSLKGTLDLLTSRRGCQRLYLVIAHRSDWQFTQLLDDAEAAVISWVVFIEDPTNPTDLTGADCLDEPVPGQAG